MRRRVATILRRGLLALGVVLLVWMPLSFAAELYVSFPMPWDGIAVRSGWGHAYVTVMEGMDRPWFHFRAGAWRHRSPHMYLEELDALVPRLQWRRSSGSPARITTVSLPIWLPAFICLAWPVTSPLLARRKPKRGFSVEPKTPDAAAPPSPS